MCNRRLAVEDRPPEELFRYFMENQIDLRYPMAQLSASVLTPMVVRSTLYMNQDC